MGVLPERMRAMGVASACVGLKRVLDALGLLLQMVTLPCGCQKLDLDPL